MTDSPRPSPDTGPKLTPSERAEKALFGNERGTHYGNDERDLYAISKATLVRTIEAAERDARSGAAQGPIQHPSEADLRCLVATYAKEANEARSELAALKSDIERLTEINAGYVNRPAIDPVTVQALDKLIIELTLKHGKATGTDYEQGAQDHGYRLLHAIRALLASPAPSKSDSCQKCGGELNGEAALVGGSQWCHSCADLKLISALHEAETYGIGATSDYNQKIILQAAKAFGSAPSKSEAVAWRGSDDTIRNLIATEIWAYQECAENFGPFNEVSVDAGDMKALAKRMAIDEAERIRKAVLASAVVKAYFAHHTTEDETYEIGKRDGYEDAIQNLDLATGGDGEFKGSTIPGETVDVPAMQARIIDRCASPANTNAEAVRLDLLAAKNAVRDECGSRLCHWTPEGPRICHREAGRSVCLCEQVASAVLSTVSSTGRAATPQEVREACAQVADRMAARPPETTPGTMARNIARAIRALIPDPSEPDSGERFEDGA